MDLQLLLAVSKLPGKGLSLKVMMGAEAEPAPYSERKQLRDRFDGRDANRAGGCIQNAGHFHVLANELLCFLLVI